MLPHYKANMGLVGTGRECTGARRLCLTACPSIACDVAARRAERAVSMRGERPPGAS